MSQIMKAFTGVFVMMFMMITGTGILGAFFQTLHAQNLHAILIDEMENSDYARVVLEESFLVVEEAGYELELTLYTEYDGIVTCKNAGELPATTAQVSMAEVILKYPFQIGFFELDVQQELFGYAR